jgi:hypothetical protein
MRNNCLTLTLALVFIGVHHGVCQDKRPSLLVHEWGTFTVLQDENGRALPGVNINEEALPSFVHRLSRDLVPDSHRYSPVLGSNQYAEKKYMSKGIPRGFPAVTMRMETPIVYFHLPQGQSEMTGVDLKVGFRNGWISEWYPQAKVDAPGFDDKFDRRIKNGTAGTIHWDNLTLRSTAGVFNELDLPQTDSSVWLAPRQVNCDVVSTAEGQSERYLFYRGVANLSAPLKVTRSQAAGKLEVSVQVDALTRALPDQLMSAVYLVHITDDNRVAFREFTNVNWSADSNGESILDIPVIFPESDYQEDSMDRLHASMRLALKNEGLFEDEANAFLATWQLSYFRSPGLRLFFTLPKSWTDQVLPLEVSESAEISRAMMGRIELITPEQRSLLQEMAAGKVSNRNWFSDALRDLTPRKREAVITEIQQGQRTLESLVVDIPDDYRAFIQLGRFRDALVLDAAKESEPLREFAQNYGLTYFE